ncbi:hypothetical protein ACFVRR_18195 [Gottfriedia sp. NPDC057948]|uniref:hypothetical protein n=1 Tax=Gottfriedia sp. NPDC057948 TaxID=3346287 RepID=UPI0036D87ECC
MIVYPDYKIDTEIDYVGKIGGLGHAGVLLISQSGNTRYYEYGRYPTTDGTKGKVRNVPVPNAYIGSNGLATDDSLIRILATLSSKSGQNGKIEAAYFKNLIFEEMDSFAMTKLKESNPEYTEYKKDREPYALTSNNCGTFAESVILKGGKISKPTIINPSPTNIVDEYWEEGYDKVTYVPKEKMLVINKQ